MLKTTLVAASLVAGVILLQGCAAQALRAQIDTSTTSGRAPLVVEFDGSGSRGPIATYRWDFDGDGTTDAKGVQAQATFKRPGEYSVTLTVFDDQGNRKQAGALIEVKAGGPQLIIGGAVDPPGVKLKPNGRGRVRVTIVGIPEPGLTELQVSGASALSFDPQVIRVRKVQGLDPFVVPSPVLKDPEKGEVRFAAFAPVGPDQPGVRGSASIIELQLDSVGQPGTIGTLELTGLNVFRLADGTDVKPVITRGYIEVTAK